MQITFTEEQLEALIVGIVSRLRDDRVKRDIEPLWTKKDVAEFFKVSEKTVSNWVETQRIPIAKPGARLSDLKRSKAEVRFDPADIQAWLKTVKIPAVTKLRVHGPARHRRHA